MLLKPVHNGRKTTAGDSTGTLPFQSGILGGVMISTDGTNAAVVTLQMNNSTGFEVFGISTKTPMWIHGPIRIGALDTDTTQVGYYSVTGTGAEARFYEWAE